MKYEINVGDEITVFINDNIFKMFIAQISIGHQSNINKTIVSYKCESYLNGTKNIYWFVFDEIVKLLESSTRPIEIKKGKL
jgi:hypothetical protein